MPAHILIWYANFHVGIKRAEASFCDSYFFPCVNHDEIQLC